MIVRVSRVIVRLSCVIVRASCVIIRVSCVIVRGSCVIGRVSSVIARKSESCVSFVNNNIATTVTLKFSKYIFWLWYFLFIGSSMQYNKIRHNQIMGCFCSNEQLTINLREVKEILTCSYRFYCLIQLQKMELEILLSNNLVRLSYTVLTSDPSWFHTIFTLWIGIKKLKIRNKYCRFRFTSEEFIPA